MIRSRDLVLFFVSVFFLLILVLGLMPSMKNNENTDVYSGNFFADNKKPATVNGDKIYKAELYQAKKIDRKNLLSDMRNKVATEISKSGDKNYGTEIMETDTNQVAVNDKKEREEFVESESTSDMADGSDMFASRDDADDEIVNDEIVEIDGGTATSSDEAVLAESFQPVLCDSYQINSFKNRVTLKSLPTGGKALYDNDKFLTTLPVNPAYRGEVCLPSDIVGIAQDGSVIRNNELSLYKIFTADTLIGYALDGWPIYGLSTEDRGNRCGANKVGNGYAYYLSENREVILNCFISTPIKF